MGIHKKECCYSYDGLGHISFSFNAGLGNCRVKSNVNEFQLLQSKYVYAPIVCQNSLMLLVVKMSVGNHCNLLGLVQRP